MPLSASASDIFFVSAASHSSGWKKSGRLEAKLESVPEMERMRRDGQKMKLATILPPLCWGDETFSRVELGYTCCTGNLFIRASPCRCTSVSLGPLSTVLSSFPTAAMWARAKTSTMRKFTVPSRRVRTTVYYANALYT